MIRHVVLFTWKPEATEEQKQAVHAELAKMPPAIDVIRAYKYGPDAGINPANSDYVVVADFDNLAGYLAYRENKEHQKIVETFVQPIVGARGAVQYEV